MKKTKVVKKNETEKGKCQDWGHTNEYKKKKARYQEMKKQEE